MKKKIVTLINLFILCALCIVNVIFLCNMKINNDGIVDKSTKFIFDGGTFANYEKPVTSCGTVFDGEWTIDVYNP